MSKRLPPRLTPPCSPRPGRPDLTVDAYDARRRNPGAGPDTRSKASRGYTSRGGKHDTARPGSQPTGTCTTDSSSGGVDWRGTALGPRARPAPAANPPSSDPDSVPLPPLGSSTDQPKEDRRRRPSQGPATPQRQLRLHPGNLGRLASTPAAVIAWIRTKTSRCKGQSTCRPTGFADRRRGELDRCTGSR